MTMMELGDDPAVVIGPAATDPTGPTIAVDDGYVVDWQIDLDESAPVLTSAGYLDG